MLGQQARELALLLLAGELREVDNRKLYVPLIEHDLAGRGLRAPHEHRAKRLLAPEHLGQRAVERAYVERADHAGGARRVICDAPGRELVEEQKLPLGVRQRMSARRQRRWLLSACALLGRRLRRVPRAGARRARSVDCRRELPQSRPLEKCPDRDLHLATLAHLGHDASSEQRVPALVEKAVLRAHLFDGEDLLP